MRWGTTGNTSQTQTLDFRSMVNALNPKAMGCLSVSELLIFNHGYWESFVYLIILLDSC